MLKFAVCDDVDADLTRIVTLTKEYLSQRHMTADVCPFDHPDALLTACEKQTFHIFLLDMVMPMVSGLELGRVIRRVSTDAQILYITTEPGFALDAYSVNPLNYLLKPVDRSALFTALDVAVKKADTGACRAVTVKTRDGLRTFSSDEILCCEYARHRALYTLTGGERVETSSLPGNFSEHIAPLLSLPCFLSPHEAFAVNMRFVERLDKSGFTLRGGMHVPVSGKQFSAVRSAYMSYRLGEM